MRKPKGTFKCKKGHISDGSELREIKRKWFCPKPYCGRVTKISDMSKDEYKASPRSKIRKIATETRAKLSYLSAMRTKPV